MTKEWGPPTWYLFHTLAEKIIDEQFDKLKMKMFDIIKLICSNLPCPDCSGHATSILNNVNPNTIRSKEHFKEFLLWFHNEVNKKTQKPQFTLEELNAKYKLAKTYGIVQYFVQVWRKRSHNPKLMALDLHKSRAVTQFISWWKENYIHFHV